MGQFKKHMKLGKEEGSMPHLTSLGNSKEYTTYEPNKRNSKPTQTKSSGSLWWVGLALILFGYFSDKTGLICFGALLTIILCFL